MAEIMAKVDDIIELIDGDPMIIRIKGLKKIMDNDTNVQKLNHDFNELKARYDEYMIVTNELIEAKKRLYDNPIVTEYKELYSHLNLIFIKYNKDVNALLHTKKHSCG